MTILDFYRELSMILEKYREHNMSHSVALSKLRHIIEESHKSNLNIDVSEKILNIEYLAKFDDERSYEEPSSYESDEDYSSDDPSSY